MKGRNPFGSPLSILLMLSIGACAGKTVSPPVYAPIPKPPPEKKTEYQILDYPGKDAGGELPQWVAEYMRGGRAAVEALSQYQKFYLFIEENSGTNISALQQWLAGFAVEQDFPRMVSSRVQERVIAEAQNAEQVYGHYFDYLVKASSDSKYWGASREDDFWVLAQSGEDHLYHYLVLVRIDKELLKTQLDSILQQAGNQDFGNQTAAIERLKINFYEGF